MSSTQQQQTPASLQRLTRLIALRAARTADSRLGSSAASTPTPSLESIESSLRRKHRAAQIVDDIVSEARTRATDGAASVKPYKAVAFKTQNGGHDAQNDSQSSVARLNRGAVGATPDPYVRYKKAPTPLIPVEVSGPQEDLWAAMAQQAAREAKEAEVRAKLERAKKIEHQKKILDDQVSLRRSRESETTQRLIDERTVIERAAAEWEADKRRERERRRDIALSVKSDREEQADARRKRKAAEEEARKLQEAQILDRIQVELEAERRRAAAIREREIQFKQELIEANERQKTLKAQRLARDADEEAAVLIHLEERLTKQEKARREAWDAMKAKMQGKEAIAFNRQSTLDDKAAEDERRAEEETQRRVEAEHRRHDEEVEARKRALMVVRDCQVEQIALRRELEEKERAAIVHEIADVERVIAKEKEEARCDREALAAKKKTQRAWLAEQMAIRNRQQTVVMSDEEQRLNAALLDRSIPRDRRSPTSV